MENESEGWGVEMYGEAGSETGSVTEGEEKLGPVLLLF